jgi:hypothetical protein
MGERVAEGRVRGVVHGKGRCHPPTAGVEKRFLSLVVPMRYARNSVGRNSLLVLASADSLT